MNSSAAYIVINTPPCIAFRVKKPSMVQSCDGVYAVKYELCQLKTVAIKYGSVQNGYYIHTFYVIQ